MLNEGAGIETDLTVVCLDKNYFRIISSAAVRTHDKAYILKHLSNEVEFKDVTDDFVCLGIFGPKSRGLLSKTTKEDFFLTNSGFFSLWNPATSSYPGKFGQKRKLVYIFFQKKISTKKVKKDM